MMKRIFGAASASLLLAGAVAFAAPASAAPTNVGGCNATRGLAGAKSTFIWPGDGKPAGLTDKNHDVAITTKVIPTAGSLTNFGTCIFTAPFSGVKTVTKWGGKLSSPVADCVSDTDSAEIPQSGKISYAFSDLTKQDTYVALTKSNPSGNGADTVGTKGIVTKGVAAGAFTDGELWYAPAVKDKTKTVDYAGTPWITDPNASAYTGYGFDIGNALGCQAAVEPGVETSNLRILIVGTGSPSEILGSTTGGNNFTIGAEYPI